MEKLVPIAAGFAAALLAASVAAAAGPGVDHVWANGAVHDLVVTGPAPAGAHMTPLYVIAPVSAAHPLHPLADARTHGFGAHDHVIALAPGRATFHGACELTLVVPGPRAGHDVAVRRTTTPGGPRPLLYAAREGGRLLPLTDAGRVLAAERGGLARLVDTHVGFACTVSPR